MKYLFAIAFVFFIEKNFAQEIAVSVFKPQGGGASWSPDGKRIVYDTKNNSAEHYYEIHVCDSSGLDDTCYSCRIKNLPQRHNGSPSFSPDGKYILFTAENAVHARSSVDAIPGFGAFSNMWLMDSQGKQVWQLTDIPNNYDHGIIGPKFSHDGKKIVWVERKERPHALKKKNIFGLWMIKVADFSFADSIPKISNIKTFEPGGDAFYETYGFSPDDSKIIFCSNMTTTYWWVCQIFTIDAATGLNATLLTENDYNEHAQYTPDGKHIIWMSDTKSTLHGTDWWMMDSDGKNKQRLTYFNEPNNAMSNGKAKWCGLVSFSPDGKTFVGGVQTSLRKQEGEIYKGKLLK